MLNLANEKRAYHLDLILGTKDPMFRYCDYVNIVKVSHKDLFEMPSHLSLMPCMALPCSLAGALPSDKRQWSERACETFQKLTYDKRLYGELVKLDARGKHEVITDRNWDN